MFVFTKPDGKNFSDDVSVCVSPLLLPHIFSVSEDWSWLPGCRRLQRWPMLLLPQELPRAFPTSSRKRLHPSTPPLTDTTHEPVTGCLCRERACKPQALTERWRGPVCFDWSLGRAWSCVEQVTGHGGWLQCDGWLKGAAGTACLFFCTETERFITSEMFLVFSSQKWKLSSGFTHNIMITSTTWDQHRRAGNSSFSYVKRKTKWNQWFSHWGQKGLRKTPILLLPLSFFY